MDFENTSVETTEVAEPSSSVETQEVAEPVQTSEETATGGKTSQDAAFAEMRRARQAAEKELAQARAELAKRDAAETAKRNAFRNIAGSETADVDALAEALGVDTDDVLASIQAEQANVEKDSLIEDLNEKVRMLSAEKQVNESIKELQALDSSITDINDLGEEFVDFVSKGLTVEQAYYAVKGKQIATTATPPKPVGKVNNQPPEKDFFTEAEVDAMTEEQQRANAKKILASMPRWK